MEDKPFWLADYHGVTTIHPVGMAITLVLGFLMLCVPRRYAALTVLAMACYVAPAQRIVVMGLDFNLVRVMVLFGWLRVLAWQEYRSFKWHTLDYLLIAWAVSQTTIHTIQNGTIDALVNRLGASFDAAGMYFLFRCLFRTWDDLVVTTRGIVLILIPVVVSFIIENRTGRNLFAFLGGVPEFTKMREGRLRCQGAFAHAILAGTFWAAIAPMIAALWWRRGIDRLYSCAGVPMCIVLVVLCASSTPVASLLFAIVAACMWPLRHYMRVVRLGIVGTLALLHVIMEKPVWHLISRIDLAGGSTGWHRYFLIDQFIKHFDEWLLLGSNSTAHWDVIDITNQYVLEALFGGLLTLCIFVAIIAVAFREVGRLWRSVAHSTWRVAMAWSLGVALFVHTTAFLGVSYFGQIIVIWYLLLSNIISMRLAELEETK